jgi:hypothetical protein
MKLNYQTESPEGDSSNSGRRSGSVQSVAENPPSNQDSIDPIGFRSENLICAGTNNSITNGRRCSIINGNGNSIGSNGFNLVSKRNRGKYNTHIIGGSNISSVLDNTFYIDADIKIAGSSFELRSNSLISSDGNITGSSDLIAGNSSNPGNIKASGSVIAYQTSDIKLKNNIKIIKNSLGKIQMIQPINFLWNEKQSLYTGRDIGVIAQQVKKVQPDIVRKKSNGHLSVDYKKIIPLLVSAIKEKQLRIQDIKLKIKLFKNE